MTMRRYLTTQSQVEGAGEPETNSSVPQQEGLADAIDRKVIIDYDLDIDYESEGSYPEIKPVDQVQEEDGPYAEYAEMEILCQGTLCQRFMSHKVTGAIEHMQRA